MIALHLCAKSDKLLNVQVSCWPAGRGIMWAAVGGEDILQRLGKKATLNPKP